MTSLTHPTATALEHSSAEGGQNSTKVDFVPSLALGFPAKVSYTVEQISRNCPLEDTISCVKAICPSGNAINHHETRFPVVKLAFWVGVCAQSLSSHIH